MPAVLASTRRARFFEPDDEPDRELLLSLLDARAHSNSCRKQPWLAERDAAIVALCWVVGFRPPQIMHLKRSAWMPKNKLVADCESPGQYDHIRSRRLPVLERARDAVAAYIDACPITLEDNEPLMRRSNGTTFDMVGVQLFAFWINRRTKGVVPTAGSLFKRFRRYVETSGATDGSIEWLVGRTGEHGALEPDIGDLRRTLERVHPASITNTVR